MFYEWFNLLSYQNLYHAFPRQDSRHSSIYSAQMVLLMVRWSKDGGACIRLERVYLRGIARSLRSIIYPFIVFSSHEIFLEDGKSLLEMSMEKSNLMAE